VFKILAVVIGTQQLIYKPVEARALRRKTLIEKRKRAAGIEPASSAWKAEPRMTQTHGSRWVLKRGKAPCETFAELACS